MGVMLVSLLTLNVPIVPVRRIALLVFSLNGQKHLARIETIRLLLSMALNQAVRWQMLPRNICQAVRPPVIPAEEDKEIRFWTPDQAKVFLEHVRNPLASRTATH
jgi:hypothetical protein